MQMTCAICNHNPCPEAQTNCPSGFTFECPWCGKYWIESSLVKSAKLQYGPQLWKVAACVREKNSQGLEVALFPFQEQIPPNAPNGGISIAQALEGFPQSLAERVDRALLNLERETKHLGQGFSIHNMIGPFLFSQNVEEIGFMLRHLSDIGCISGYQGTFPCHISLTATGLSRAADLNRGALGALSKQAFVAMSFNKSLDSAWLDGLKLGIEDCDYTALRIDSKEHNEKICDAIVAEIRKSKFLVADFTGHRGGVYFEAGLMMGLGRPVIFTCRGDDIKNAHFDTRQYNHIAWDSPGDLREKLKRRIQATITT